VNPKWCLKQSSYHDIPTSRYSICARSSCCSSRRPPSTSRAMSRLLGLCWRCLFVPKNSPRASQDCVDQHARYHRAHPSRRTTAVSWSTSDSGTTSTDSIDTTDTSATTSTTTDARGNKSRAARMDAKGQIQADAARRGLFHLSQDPPRGLPPRQTLALHPGSPSLPQSLGECRKRHLLRHWRAYTLRRSQALHIPLFHRRIHQCLIVTIDSMPLRVRYRAYIGTGGRKPPHFSIRLRDCAFPDAAHTASIHPFVYPLDSPPRPEDDPQQGAHRTPTRRVPCQ
jgi:hypothetical protein